MGDDDLSDEEDADDLGAVDEPLDLSVEGISKEKTSEPTVNGETKE